MYGYYDEYDGWFYPGLRYTSIDIEDVPSDDLAEGHKVISFADLKARKHKPYAPVYKGYRKSYNHNGNSYCTLHASQTIPLLDNNRKRNTVYKPVQVYDTGKNVINPADGAAVFAKHAVDISFFYRQDGDDLLGWQVFDFQGIAIDRSLKIKHLRETNQKKSLLQFKVTLKQDYGYLQLLCRAKKGLHSSGKIYPHNTLRTIFFYRGKAVFEDYHYPPVLPVVVNTAQTFVPMLVQQKLQLITPKNCVITQANDHKNASWQHALVHTTSKTTSNDTHMSHLFNCYAEAEFIAPIFFEKHIIKDSNGTAIVKPGVVIVPVVEKVNGEHYAVLVSPRADFTLCLNGIKGFIIRSPRDNTTYSFKDRINWLDQTCRFKIEDKSICLSEAHSEYNQIRVAVMDRSKMFRTVKNFFSKDCVVS